MKLSPRETLILYITIAVVFSYGAWLFVVGPVASQWAETAQAMEKEQELFESRTTVLASRRSIEEEFLRIQATIPADESDARTAANVFSEEVVALAEQIMGAPLRDLGVVEAEPFREAQGFEILSFPIKTSGNWETVSRLLKAFDQRGFLIRSVLLTPRGLDSPEIQCDITLSRVVKIRERPNERRRPGARAGGTTIRP